MRTVRKSFLEARTSTTTVPTARLPRELISEAIIAGSRSLCSRAEGSPTPSTAGTPKDSSTAPLLHRAQNTGRYLDARDSVRQKTTMADLISGSEGLPGSLGAVEKPIRHGTGSGRRDRKLGGGSSAPGKRKRNSSQQQQEGWGAKVIDQLGKDLRQAFS